MHVFLSAARSLASRLAFSRFLTGKIGCLVFKIKKKKKVHYTVCSSGQADISIPSHFAVRLGFTVHSISSNGGGNAVTRDPE